MRFDLTKQTKLILLFALTVALLGGVFYGGYRYWQSQQVVPEPQEPQEPPEEKKVEIVENPDGSKTYYSYIYNYKVGYPEGWELERPTAENVYREINLRKKDSGRTRLEDIVVLSGDAVEGVTFEEYLDEQRQHNLGEYQEELISQNPNFEFANTPVYRYELPSPWESLVLSFEHDGVWYEIWMHQNHRDDAEYWSVLNTFGFIK